MKRLIALILCMAMLGLSAVAETGMFGNGKGYLTPRGAILAYLEGLRDQDLEQALSAFPWGQLDVSGHFRDAILGYSSYTPESWPVFPGSTNLQKDINAALLYCQATEDLCSFFALLTFPDDGSVQNDQPDNMPVSMLRTAIVKTAEDADALLASFDLSRLDVLAGIDHIRVLEPEDVTDLVNIKFNRLEEMLERYRVRYGADKTCERVVYFTLGSQEYVFAPVLARYGLHWYIVSLYGYLAARLGINGGTSPFRLAGDAVKPPLQTGEIVRSESSSLPWNEVGGSTPEEAVSLYLDGLRQDDLSAVMGAFAWETMRRNTSLRTAVLTTTYYSGTKNWPVFAEGNDMLEQVDIVMHAKTRVNRLAMSLVDYYTDGALFSDQQWIIQHRLPVRSEEDADAVLAMFDEKRNEQLGTLDNIRFSSPKAVVPASSMNTIQENMERYRKLYGADEITELIAAFTIAGEEYVIMPQLLRYGDRWYISTLNSISAIICNVPLTNCALCKLSDL